MSLKIKISSKIKAYTLAELLVVIIISGIVILSVMEGWGLLSRYTTSLTDRVTANSRLYDGYYRLHEIASTADSITPGATCWHGGEKTELKQQDSVIIAIRGGLKDTLLIGATLELKDSLIINLRSLRLTYPIK